MGKVFRVGLTGGSATGKTTVANFLAELGATVIDADAIASHLLQKDSPAYRETVQAFGPSILTREGPIDRKRLSRIVFSDPAQRRTLEGILHPRILEEEDRRIYHLHRTAGSLEPGNDFSFGHSHTPFGHGQGLQFVHGFIVH